MEGNTPSRNEQVLEIDVNPYTKSSRQTDVTEFDKYILLRRLRLSLKKQWHKPLQSNKIIQHQCETVNKCRSDDKEEE